MPEAIIRERCSAQRHDLSACSTIHCDLKAAQRGLHVLLQMCRRAGVQSTCWIAMLHIIEHDELVRASRQPAAREVKAFEGTRFEFAQLVRHKAAAISDA